MLVATATVRPLGLSSSRSELKSSPDIEKGRLKKIIPHSVKVRANHESYCQDLATGRSCSQVHFYTWLHGVR